MTGPVRLPIEVWSDVMCPWCIIGYKQLERALGELEGEIEAEICWRPFELNPDMPEEGEDIERHMLRKYGQAPSASGTDRMSRIAERAGYAMRYMGEGPEPPRRMWNTLRAHKLLAWALSEYGPARQTELKLALFDAHFQQRRNVSDPAVLLSIAEALGLDGAGRAAALESEDLAKSVKAEEREAIDRGITAVPMMLISERFMVPGAQKPEVYVDALRKVASRL